MEKISFESGLKPVFVEAVYGAELSQEKLNRACDHKATIDTFGRSLSAGEVGCALSHFSIYEKMINEDIEHALVLEDDVVFTEDLVSSINHIINSGSLYNSDILFLGGFTDTSRSKEPTCSCYGKVRLADNCLIKIPIEKVYGTHAYIISKSCARRIVGLGNTFRAPIDHITGDIRKLSISIVQPVVVQPHAELSAQSSIDDGRDTITEEYASREKLRLSSWRQNVLVRKIVLFVKRITPLRLWVK